MQICSFMLLMQCNDLFSCNVERYWVGGGRWGDGKVEGVDHEENVEIISLNYWEGLAWSHACNS